MKCAVIERKTEKRRVGCRSYRVHERGLSSFTQDKTFKYLKLL